MNYKCHNDLNGISIRTYLDMILLTKAIIFLCFWQILARGQTVLHKSHKNPGQIIVLRFRVTPEMCPSMRVVVYYTVYTNGKTEVVADYAVVDVVDEFKNKVRICFILLTL